MSASCGTITVREPTDGGDDEPNGDEPPADQQLLLRAGAAGVGLVGVGLAVALARRQR